MTNRWIPSTVQDLENALEAGALKESHYCDVKADLAPGVKGNTRLAIDLASFAVDGGQIIVGIAEQDGVKRLVAIPLKGLKERIDQVARSRIDPPLTVTSIEIPAGDTARQGYLVIVIPASPDAPHMVDHIYRGRGDTTNVELTDAEVRRIRELRARAAFDVRDLLSDEVKRDPYPEGELGHITIVAEPVFAPRELLVELAGNKWQEWLYQTFREVPLVVPQWGPDISGVMGARTTEGWALRSWKGQREATAGEDESGVIELEIRENGGIRLFCARAADRSNALLTLMDAVIYGLIWRAIDAAATVSRISGFVGNWHFGVAITGIKGAPSHDWVRRSSGHANEYGQDDYIAATEATFAQLNSDYDPIMRRLTDRLNRTVTDGQRPLPRKPS